MVTIDFETYWSQTFSLSKLTTESYIRSPEFEVIGVCVKEDDGPTVWISGSDEHVKQALQAYRMESKAVCAHNAVFDMSILSWRYGIRPALIVDTLSMSRPITGISVGGSLKALSEHFGIGEKGTEVYNTKGKHRRDFTNEEMQRFAEYCVQDVELTYKLFHKLKPFSTSREMRLIDLTIRMFTEPVIELDTPKLARHLAEVRAKKEALLSSVAMERDVLMSNAKFAELLRAEGVEPPTKISPTTGKETFALAKTDEAFKELLSHPNERVQALAAARLGVKSTIEETRTQAFLDISKRGPLPIMLNYYGAANTGRWSGADGINPQNLPRGGVLRDAMMAPAGHVLVACDSSQIEARTLAWFAGQDDLVEAFAAGKDVYSMFASTVYGKPINKHDNPTERFVGKTSILGLGYQVGGQRLLGALKNGGVKITLDECKNIVNTYRTAYSKITNLWSDGQKVIDNMFRGYHSTFGVGVQLPVDGVNRCVTLPNGMKLQYPGLTAVPSEKGGLEYQYKKKRFTAKLYGGSLTENVIQSLARIIVGYQMLDISRELSRMAVGKYDGKIRKVVHMVHDEVIVVVPEEEADETKAMMERIMSTPPDWAQGLPVACEAGVGRTYGEAK